LRSLAEQLGTRDAPATCQTVQGCGQFNGQIDLGPSEPRHLQIASKINIHLSHLASAGFLQDWALADPDAMMLNRCAARNC